MCVRDTSDNVKDYLVEAGCVCVFARACVCEAEKEEREKAPEREKEREEERERVGEGGGVCVREREREGEKEREREREGGGERETSSDVKGSSIVCISRVYHGASCGYATNVTYSATLHFQGRVSTYPIF